MYEDNLVVGKCLKLLFIGEILAAISALLGDGRLSVLVSLASVIVSLVGLNIAAPAHPKFRTAFRLNIALCILCVVALVVEMILLLGGLVISLMHILIAVVGIWHVYLICTAAGEILTAGGFDAEAARGRTAWKFCLANMVLSLLFTVAATFILSLMTAIGTAGVMTFSFVSSLVMWIVRLAYVIVYLMFLYHAYHALLYGQ